MGLLNLLSTNEIVAQIINFLLLLLFLRVFFWKRILKLLDERKQRIASEFKNIEQTKTETAKTKADYEAKLAEIEKAAQKIIQEALEKSKLIENEARQKSQIMAQEIIDNAQKSLQYELAKAKLELREEIVDLTIRAAENVISEKLTGEEDKKLVRYFLEKIDNIS